MMSQTFLLWLAKTERNLHYTIFLLCHNADIFINWHTSRGITLVQQNVYLVYLRVVHKLKCFFHGCRAHKEEKHQSPQTEIVIGWNPQHKLEVEGIQFRQQKLQRNRHIETCMILIVLRPCKKFLRGSPTYRHIYASYYMSKSRTISLQESHSCHNSHKSYLIYLGYWSVWI